MTVLDGKALAQEVRARIAAQAPLEDKAAVADVVIDNDGPPEDLEAQVDRLWSIWQAKPANSGKNPTLSGNNRIMDPWQETAAQVRSIASLGYSYGP